MKAYNIKALLVIIALAFSSTVAANPLFNNGNCETSGCHDNTSGGIVSVPDIDVGIDSIGNTLTFTLTGSWNANATIALFDTEATGLDMTIGTPDTWSALQSGAGGSPVLPFIYATPVFDDATTSYDLTFDIGNLAALGTYTIGVKFAGGTGGGIQRWADLASFDVTVVPIPAAVWLFGSGLIGLVAIARRRRNS